MMKGYCFILIMLISQLNWAQPIRVHQIENLLAHGDYHQVIKLTQQDQSTTSQCYHEYVLQKMGLKNKSIINSLWLVPHSQPPACDHLFNYWKTKKILTEEIIFERYILMLRHDQLHLANYLKKMLDNKKQASLAKIYYHQPEKIYKQSLENLNHLTIRLAIERVAEKKSTMHAEALYHFLKKRVQFNQEDEKSIHEIFSTYYALENKARSKFWFKKINQKPLQLQTIAWQIRYHLKNKEWAQVEKIIHLLPKKNYEFSQWQYWLAYALKQSGKDKAANKIYASISKVRDIYGMLAAIQLKRPLPFNNTPLNLKKSEIDSMSRRLAHLKNHFLKDFSHYPGKKWDNIIKKMTERERIVAAYIALKWHQPYLAIRTTNTLLHNPNHLSIRFPIHYQNAVQSCQKKHGIPSALLYAMIRQESSFQKDAHSNHGAYGLMQLLPQTAAYIAKKNKITYKSKRDLLKSELNIKLGCEYIAYLIKKFDNHLLKAIAAYNMGPGNIQKELHQYDMDPLIWIENLSRSETRDYLKNILTYILIYQYQLGQKPNIDVYLKRF